MPSCTAWSKTGSINSDWVCFSLSLTSKTTIFTVKLFSSFSSHCSAARIPSPVRTLNFIKGAKMVMKKILMSAKKGERELKKVSEKVKERERERESENGRG